MLDRRLGAGLLKEIKRVYLYAVDNNIVGDGEGEGFKLPEEAKSVLEMVAEGNKAEGEEEEEEEEGEEENKDEEGNNEERAAWTDDTLADAMSALGGAFDRLGEEKLGELTLSPKPNDSNDLFGNAVRCFGIASCFRMNDCDLLCKMGKTFEELGMSDVAIGVVKDSLNLEGRGREHAESMYYLATSFESKGEFKKATKIFQRASELAARDGNVDLLSSSLRSIGVCLDGQEKWKEAAKAYSVASELSQDLPELVSARGISLKNGGFYTDAEKAFKNAADLFENNNMEDHANECRGQAKECSELNNTD